MATDGKSEQVKNAVENDGISTEQALIKELQEKNKILEEENTYYQAQIKMLEEKLKSKCEMTVLTN